MSRLNEEWDALPYDSSYRTPITASIPYFFRWKINQAKLMLSDIETLRTKYKLVNADELHEIIKQETEILFKQLAVLIKQKQTWREKSE